MSLYSTAINVVFLTLLVSLAACDKSPRGGGAGGSSTTVQVGKTAEKQLIEQKGQPVQVKTAADRPQAKLLWYPGHELFQTENGKVVARFRAPGEQERTLQYWRHLWRGKNPVYEEIGNSRDAHGKSKYTLRATSEGMAVIYDPEQDEVTDVVQYAKAE